MGIISNPVDGKIHPVVGKMNTKDQMTKRENSFGSLAGLETNDEKIDVSGVSHQSNLRTRMSRELQTFEIDDEKKPEDSFSWTEEIRSAIADWTFSLVLGFLVVSFWRVSDGMMLPWALTRL